MPAESVHLQLHVAIVGVFCRCCLAGDAEAREQASRGSRCSAFLGIAHLKLSVPL